jgi:hypothetical protein
MEFEYYDDEFELEQEDEFIEKRPRGKTGKRIKPVNCDAFQQQVQELYLKQKPFKDFLDKQLIELLKKNQIVLQSKGSRLLNDYIQSSKSKELKELRKKTPGLIWHSKKDLTPELKQYFLIQREIDLLKKETVWKCYSEIQFRLKKLVGSVAYKRGFGPDEKDNLEQESVLFFHHLHLYYNPFFLEGKIVPYGPYMLNMMRSKLGYFTQVHFQKKGKEELRDAFHDHELLEDYHDEVYDTTFLKCIEKRIHPRYHEFLKDFADGMKRKDLQEKYNYTASWISLVIKEEIKPAIKAELENRGEVDLIERYFSNL